MEIENGDSARVRIPDHVTVRQQGSGSGSISLNQGLAEPDKIVANCRMPILLLIQ